MDLGSCDSYVPSEAYLGAFGPRRCPHVDPGFISPLWIWLWVKNRHPKWSPGKWIQGLKPAVRWFHFDPYPYGAGFWPQKWSEPYLNTTGTLQQTSTPGLIHPGFRSRAGNSQANHQFVLIRSGGFPMSFQALVAAVLLDTGFSRPSFLAAKFQSVRTYFRLPNMNLRFPRMVSCMVPAKDQVFRLPCLTTRGNRSCQLRLNALRAWRVHPKKDSILGGDWTSGSAKTVWFRVSNRLIKGIMSTLH